MVVNAITLETLGEALKVMGELPFTDVDIVSVTAAKSRELGRYHMMMGRIPSTLFLEPEVESMRLNRVLITAPKSGSGKTLVTCGLLGILKKRGIRTASFKCGPDLSIPCSTAGFWGPKAGIWILFYRSGYHPDAAGKKRSRL